jgi:hypothetical protein
MKEKKLNRSQMNLKITRLITANTTTVSDETVENRPVLEKMAEFAKDG